MTRSRIAAAAILFLGAACVKAPDAPPRILHARFDPAARAIPMPSDVVRDDAAGHLDLDVDAEGLSPAERELYVFLNGRDGWSTASQAKVEFTGAVKESSVTPETVQVWEFDTGASVRLENSLPALDDARAVLSIDPPKIGWKRGARIAVVVRGGASGVQGLEGEKVECDAAFYFLRLTTPLTDPAHERAFPGATHEERQANAAKLEALRLELAPYFAHFEARGIPRNEVAALWVFTVTTSTELAMDKFSGRMPLPINLLLDPDTGLAALPERPDDSELAREIKRSLKIYDGFGPTMSPYFELTAPIDPATVDPTRIRFFRIADPPEPVPFTIGVSDDHLRVHLTPSGGPLLPGSLYALVVRPGILDTAGKPIAPMNPGHLLGALNPLFENGHSTIGALPDEDARKLEHVRLELAPALDALGRSDIAVAWPMRIMTVAGPLIAAQRSAETLGTPVDPEDVVSMSPAAAAFDFPMGALSLFRVKRVFQGSIATPDFLDPLTRSRREGGAYETRRIAFTLTIPDGAEPGTPLPVVIFGHGLMTERRFVLAIADAFAAKGYAAISIDFPYHGTRSVCAWNGPSCIPNPFSTTGEMFCPAPCQFGSSCQVDGRCLDGNGAETELAKYPVVPMYLASGAAFVEVDHINYTRDHFMQAVTDLGALSRSLRLGDWESATGYRFAADEVLYAGQSLGGILGATYTPLDPHVTRAVLNVPGSNLVDMFTDSAIFGSHIDAFLEREEIVKGTADHQKFVNVAHWLMDAVDPANVARNLVGEPLPEIAMPANRKVFLQMAMLDLIIPNSATEYLQTAAGEDVPRIDYLAEHGFLTIPLEPAYPFGVTDAADFLEGTLYP